jgi:hypothetical protein
MFAIASFFALMSTASASARLRSTISGSETSANPGSRARMNHAFSAKRAMSSTSFLPCFRASAAVAAMFSIDTGWPPPALFVSVSMTIETRSPSSLSSKRPRASMSRFPLNGFPTGIESGRNGKIQRDTLTQLDVGARRIEMRVRRHDLTWVDDGAEEDALGSTALMGRHDVGKSEHLPDGVAETREAARAGIGLIAPHERRPLILAHSTRAGVGQEIELDVSSRKLERVPSGRLERVLALRPRRSTDRLDHLDPEGLAWRTHPGVLSVLRPRC